MSIPRILHYCFGMAPDFGGKPWSLVHYVCLRSAIEHIRPEQVYFYFEHEPQTAWWKLVEPLINKVKIEAPRQIFGRPLLSPAHRADAVRMMALADRGGIYLDADVMVHRDFDDLLGNNVVLGQEGADGQYGLCNAVILARPHSEFITRWLDQYRWFRGTFHDQPFWNEHSVQLPHFMSKLFPQEITVLGQDAFFGMSWRAEDMYRLFVAPDVIDVSKMYASHLWETVSWPYVSELTPGILRSSRTNFSMWALPYLEGLSDDFGSVEEEAAVEQGRYRRETFQDIYAQGFWGKDTNLRFCSGVGSRGPVATTYVAAIRSEIESLRRELQLPVRIVDIGCGDFVVGSNLLINTPDIYIGCDIVPELIDYNKTLSQSERISFHQLDAVVDTLPEADVYLVRQVLQHLNNSDISAILGKLRGKTCVYVTEGHPIKIAGPVNPDKPTGHDVRFDWRTGIGRGVELDEEPFGMTITPICQASNGLEVVKTWRVQC